MVDLGPARDAFGEFLPRGRHGASGEPGVLISAPENVGLAIVMARRGKAAELAALVLALHGVALPTNPRRVAAGPRAFIGIAPGQWLAAGENLPDLADELARDLAGLASVSAQSDGRALVRLGGPRARETLMKGAPLDLHPSVFGPGAAAATQIAHISAILWRIDAAPTYEIALPRSMAGDFAHWLMLSAAEFGAEVD